MPDNKLVIDNLDGLNEDSLEAAKLALEEINASDDKDKDTVKDPPVDDDTSRDDADDSGDSEKEGKEDGSDEGEDTIREDEKILELEEAELTEKEKGRKTELLKEADEENDRILKAKDEDLSEEEVAHKKELIKAQEDDVTVKAETEKFEAKVKEYSEKNNISLDQAKDQLTTEYSSAKKIADKYGNDVVETARANLHLQQALSKADRDLKEAKSRIPKPQPVSGEGIRSLVERRMMVIGGKNISKEDLVTGYRTDYPNDVNDLDDDQVFLIATQRVADIHNAQVEKPEDLEKKGVSRRKELINSLSEKDKQWEPEVKAVLDRVTDRAVANESFSVNEILLMVKGQHLEDYGEKRYKEGLEKGKTKPRIIRIPGGKPRPSSSKKGGVSESFRRKAMETFSNMDEEEAIEMYKEFKDDIPKIG